MSQINNIHGIVMDVLQARPEARGDDFKLYAYVADIMGAKIHDTFYYSLISHEKYELPSWETITRCRRKIQRDRPDLCDPKAKNYRAAEIEDYKEYAKK